MTINVAKLSRELQAAQIPFSGVNDAGVVWDVDENRTEIQNQPNVAAIILAHDPIDYEEIARQERFDSAPLEMANVGNGWPTYTVSQAVDWVNTNIGTPLDTPIPPNPMTVQQIRASIVLIVSILQSFKTLNIAMIKMIIALRNRTRL